MGGKDAVMAFDSDEESHIDTTSPQNQTGSSMPSPVCRHATDSSVTNHNNNNTQSSHIQTAFNERAVHGRGNNDLVAPLHTPALSSHHHSSSSVLLAFPVILMEPTRAPYLNITTTIITK